MAPLGYLNDVATKTIVKDPVHFPLVRKMFDLMLTGAYTPFQIALIARDEWGFLTPKRRKIGGVPLAMSSIYKMLSNPFYAGVIVWGGQTYPGKHEPIVRLDEFDRVRALLARPVSVKPRKHEFAFTGMIRCGRCGLAVTAEHKTNNYGARYVYYHCTKRQLGPRCHQPSVEIRSLESQIEQFLKSLDIDGDLERWIHEELQLKKPSAVLEDEARKQSLSRATAETHAQLVELTGLRIRNLIGDDEFMQRRQVLRLEEMRLAENASDIEGVESRFELLSNAISLRKHGPEWFRDGNDRDKRLILETVGSNFTLVDKKLSIQAAKPFAVAAKSENHPCRLAGVDHYRTFSDANGLSNILSRIMVAMDEEPKRSAIAANLRALQEKFARPTLQHAA
jgi:hypothetical protein